MGNSCSSRYSHCRPMDLYVWMHKFKKQLVNTRVCKWSGGVKISTPCSWRLFHLLFQESVLHVPVRFHPLHWSSSQLSAVFLTKHSVVHYADLHFIQNPFAFIAALFRSPSLVNTFYKILAERRLALIFSLIGANEVPNETVANLMCKSLLT